MLAGITGTSRYIIAYLYYTRSPQTISPANSNNTVIANINMDSNKHILVYNDENNNILYDGNEVSLTGTLSDLATQNPRSITLFGRNNGNSTDLKSSFKLYNCKITNKDTNTLERNFIPCYRNSDNVVGLYDLVNNVFYTNQGTGSFTYGSVINIPNPDYPQPINNLTRNLLYKINSKNKTPTSINDWESGQYNGNGYKQDMASRIKLKELLPIKPNTTYYVNTFDITGFNLNHVFILRECDANGDFINSIGTVSNTKTFTTRDDTHYLMVTIGTTNTQSGETFEDYQTYFNEGKLKPFICLANKEDKSYEPYIEPQTFNIPLGDIELCEVGTYEDKIYSSDGRFYLYKVINKVIFDGSENWRNAYGESLFDIYSYFNSKPFIVGYGLSNYYKYNSIQSGLNAGLLNGEFALQLSGANHHMFIKNTSFTNVTDFKTWLSIHNTIVYYPLVTSTTTEITQENYPLLYNALKQIQDYLTAYKINKEFILNYDELNINY